MTSLFCLTACGENPDTPSGHEHSYTEQVTTESYLASEATCTQKATYYYSCSCGEKGTNTFEYGEALGHDYGAWVNDGNGNHVKTCSRDSEHVVSEACSGGTASCTQKAVCSVCHEKYGEKLAHNFEGDVCSVCGAKKPSEGLNFNLTWDEKSYRVSGIGTCTDKDVVIPEMYAGLPVTGIGENAFA